MRSLLGSILATLYLLMFGAWANAAPTDAIVLLDQTKELVAAGEQKQALVAVQKAVEAIWEKTPYHIDKVLLTEDKSSGYGLYNPRPTNT